MKKFLAILLTLAMVFAFAACGAKDEPAPTETDTTVTESETAADTTAPEESTEPATDENGETVAPEETTEAEAAAMPEEKADIIALYNKAIEKACDAKAGYSKDRYTDSAVFDMSLALKAFQGLVEKFVGIGADNRYTETVAKGQWATDTQHQYLRKSTLTEADVTNATCKEDGDYYVITLNIKNGSSQGDEGHTSSVASLDKCGLCVGNEDKNYYDHKSGPVIYDAIEGTYKGAKITESYSNAVAVLKISKDTMEIDSFTVNFNIKVGIDISIGSGTATGASHVTYKNFKY